MTRSLNTSEIIVVVILRTMGTGGLLAIPAIFFPYSWMNACHELLGLGAMPDAPIVTYLARSLSAFYAIVGAFLIYISWDIRRYRSLVRLWAMIAIAMGLVLFGIDLTSGLPTGWTFFEGPMTLTIGIVLLWCQRRIGEDDIDKNQES
jgi:hypothetical protein